MGGLQAGGSLRFALSILLCTVGTAIDYDYKCLVCTLCL